MSATDRPPMWRVQFNLGVVPLEVEADTPGAAIDKASKLLSQAIGSGTTYEVSVRLIGGHPHA